jgi:hypothetical protein
MTGARADYSRESDTTTTTATGRAKRDVDAEKAAGPVLVAERLEPGLLGVVPPTGFEPALPP